MKPAEEIAREISDIVPSYFKVIVEDAVKKIVMDERIEKYKACRDVRKKCAEVARSKMIRGDYKDCPAGWMNNAYTIFAKAIEEMELK